VSVLQIVWNRLDSHDCVEMAARVAFYFSLSVFPFLLVLVSLLGWVPTTPGWQPVAAWLTAYFPEASRRLIFRTLMQLSRDYAGFLSFGLIVTLWGASSGFVSLMEALSVVYGSKDRRSFLKKRTIAICATLVSAMFLIAAFLLWDLGHVVAAFLSEDSPHWIFFSTQWIVVRWSATLLLLCFAVDLINYFLPCVRRKWRWVTPGTVFVAASFVFATAALNFYIVHSSNISKIYGALTGFIVLMLWIYATSLILLVGAETDTALAQFQAGRIGARPKWPGNN
jgi:membrane protein